MPSLAPRPPGGSGTQGTGVSRAGRGWGRGGRGGPWPLIRPALVALRPAAQAAVASVHLPVGCDQPPKVGGAPAVASAGCRSTGKRKGGRDRARAAGCTNQAAAQAIQVLDDADIAGPGQRQGLRQCDPGFGLDAAGTDIRKNPVTPGGLQGVDLARGVLPAGRHASVSHSRLRALRSAPASQCSKNRVCELTPHALPHPRIPRQSHGPHCDKNHLCLSTMLCNARLPTNLWTLATSAATCLALMWALEAAA